MSYKENSDYINVNLKRAATEDEIQVLNHFWSTITPYRYLKNASKKIKKGFSNDMFFEKPLKTLKIKNRNVFINSYCADNNIGDCVKKTLVNGIKPECLLLSAGTDDKSIIDKIGQYYYHCGIPVTNTEIKKYISIPKVDVFSFALKKKKEIKKQKISNGLNIVVVGEPTVVNDGIAPNPYIQKMLMDLTQEAYDKKFVKAIQSCENGIFKAILKLIKNKKWGIYVSVDNLHKQQDNMSAWEYLTAKNSEQLIFAVPNRKLVDFLKLVDKYELMFSIIGKIDKSKSVRVVNKNAQVIYLNKKLIFNPILKVNSDEIQNNYYNYVYGENITKENIYNILNDDLFKSKKILYRSFDGIVGNKTSFLSKENGISELWYPKIKTYISLAIHSNTLQFGYNSYIAGQNTVCEAIRKIVAIGHKPLGIYVNCAINFDKPNAIKKVTALKDGIYHASKKMKLKVINIVINQAEEDDFSVVIIGKKKKHEKLFVPIFENAQKVYVIGKLDNLPATSMYQKILGNNVYPYPDEINFKFEKKLLKCVKYLQINNLLSAIIPVERFGVAGAVIKAIAPKKLGFKSERTDLNLNYMFSEIQSRFVIATTKEVELALKKYKIPFMFLGKTKSPDFIEFSNQKINCEDFYSKYYL